MVERDLGLIWDGPADLEGTIDSDNLIRRVQPWIYETVRSRDHRRRFQFLVDLLWSRFELEGQRGEGYSKINNRKSNRPWNVTSA